MSNPPKHHQQPRTCGACGRICCVPVTLQGEEYVAVGQRLDRHRSQSLDGETIVLEDGQAALSHYASMCRVTAESEGWQLEGLRIKSNMYACYGRGVYKKSLYPFPSAPPSRLEYRPVVTQPFSFQRLADNTFLAIEYHRDTWVSSQPAIFRTNINTPSNQMTPNPSMTRRKQGNEEI